MESASLTLTYLVDIEDVGQQLIEDNIVSVSRQMIDKEASVPKSNSRQNGHAKGNDDDEMEE
jgi:26S proteasome regulatory subunit N11